MSGAILLVHSDIAVLRQLGGRLEDAGFEVTRELDGTEALQAASRLEPDVAVVDVTLPPIRGESLLRHLDRQGVSVIAVVDGEDPARAVAAVREGAGRILRQPVDPDLLLVVAGQAAEETQLRRAAAALARADATGGRIDRLGKEPPMRAVAQQITSLVQSERTTVLITGERGTGKGWVARLIHDLGPRAGEPFLTVPVVGDVGALESRLFGSDPGPEGDSHREHGVLEVAGQGTVLVREVGALPPELQPTVLRVLEQRTFRRVGGNRDLAALARLLATTSLDLAVEVDAGRFREDLAYRLNAVSLRLPPVRERGEQDRRALIEAAHARLADRQGEPPPPLAPETVDRLLGYPWPGNVAEIEHVVERSALLAGHQPMILVEHLPGEFRARPGLGDRRHHPMTLDEVERRQIESSLRFHGGNRTRAAKELRISRATLINKIRKYRISE